MQPSQTQTKYQIVPKVPTQTTETCETSKRNRERHRDTDAERQTRERQIVLPAKNISPTNSLLDKGLRDYHDSRLGCGSGGELGQAANAFFRVPAADAVQEWPLSLSTVLGSAVFPFG